MFQFRIIVFKSLSVNRMTNQGRGQSAFASLHRASALQPSSVRVTFCLERASSQLSFSSLFVFKLSLKTCVSFGPFLSLRRRPSSWSRGHYNRVFRRSCPPAPRFQTLLPAARRPHSSNPERLTHSTESSCA